MENILFISEETLKEMSSINENVDSKYLTNIIIDCQDIYIHPIIGSGIYNELKSQIKAGTITDAGNARNKTLLDEYIIPALIAWVKYESPIELNYKLTNKNVSSKDSENSQPAADKTIEKLMDRFKDKAEWRSERITRYLMENRSLFPLFDNPGTGYDTIRPRKNNFTCGMFLEDTDIIQANRKEYFYYKCER